MYTSSVHDAQGVKISNGLFFASQVASILTDFRLFTQNYGSSKPILRYDRRV